MTEHTPGPWRYQEGADAYTHIVRGDGNFICQLQQDRSGRAEADARLIAAAPEMLAALQRADRYIESTKFAYGETHNMIRAAIAKAEGASSPTSAVSRIMTQEQIMRQMLQGFVSDPPDCEYHEGFLAALELVANEVMGFAFDDEILVQVRALSGPTPPTRRPRIEKLLKVIDGGKTPTLKSPQE